MALSYAISALPAIGTDAGGDLLAIVDVSDFTEAPTGTTKKITVTQLFTAPTVTNALTFATAVSQVVPGATSFAIRNNANSANNMILTDAGAATFRGIVESSLSAAAGIMRVTSVGGSGRSYDMRSNTDGSWSLVDVTAGATRITMSAGGTTTFGAGIVAGGSNFSGAVAISSGGLSVTGATTLNSGLNVTGTSTLTGTLSVSQTLGVTGVTTLGNVLAFSTSNTYVNTAGTVQRTPLYGIVLQAVTGSTNDFILASPAGLNIAEVPTGTQNIKLSGGLQVVGASSLQAITASSTLAVSGLSTLNKIKGGGSAPTAVAAGGAGTGPTISVTANATDMFGEVSIILGTSPSTLFNLLTLTYASAYTGTAPFPVIAPSNGQGADALVYVNGYSTTGFSVACRSLSGVGTIKFTYHVGQ